MDVFLDLPFDFEGVWAARAEVPIGGLTIPVIDLETLIAMKIRAGRPRDLSDVEQLERIKTLKKSGRIP